MVGLKKIVIMKRNYYVSYLTDGGNPLEVFKIIEAESLSNAYRILCATQGLHYHGETPGSDEKALEIIRKGSLGSSFNYGFLIQDELAHLSIDTLTEIFKKCSIDEFIQYFTSSKEKIVRTGIAHQYPQCEALFRAAEQPYINQSAYTKRFERTFLPRTWFENK